MNEEYVKKVEQLIVQRELINQQLQNLAKEVNPGKSWKRVIREDLNLII